MRGRWGGFAEIFVLTFVIAAFYLLVRPRSKAVELVDAISGAAYAIVRRATDLAEGER